MKRLLTLVMALAMTASLAACSGGNDSSSSAPASSGAASTPASSDGAAAPADSADYKDTLILGTASDQDIMDGQNNVTNDKILRTVYSQLIRRNADSVIEGDLAESWEVSEDELTWTFHLKKGVKFHNGKELTAKDVKASYDRLLNADDPQRYTATMNYIDRCEMVDDYTVQLITKQPSGPMLASLCARANLILDADYIEKYGRDIGTKPETINGTGPYKLVEWNKDEEMVFERFDDYFRGPAATKNLIIQIIPEANSRAIALESGEIDIADGLNGEDVARLDGTDGIKVEARESNGQHLYQFNCKDPIIADTRVRQAISYAIDRHVICETLFGDYEGTPCTAPLHPLTFGYTDLGVIERDVEKAKSLLAEAGYADGFDLTVMTGNYAKSTQVCEIMKEQLAEVGINLILDVVENATFKANLNGVTPDQFKWGMFNMGAGPGSVDADEGLRRLYTTPTGETNENNYGWYSNAKVDELLNAAAITTDSEERLKLYAEAQQILYIDDPVGIWLNDRKNIYVMSDKVENFSVEVKNIVFFENISVRK
ncbi:MAG: ABC transporter substrate-binding protein [Provencibacterium sp.]|jgi:ABC-type transport system substrate-binding protein|nr:ABC transporter substrate-binding protein [Provencibacterium sp.]